MPYTIRYLQNGKTVAEERWDHSIAAAVEMADARIDKGDDDWDCVEIVDQDGAVVADHPPVMRKAR